MTAGAAGRDHHRVPPQSAPPPAEASPPASGPDVTGAPVRASTVLADRMAAALVHREPGWRLPRRTALARRYNVSLTEIDAALGDLARRHHHPDRARCAQLRGQLLQRGGALGRDAALHHLVQAAEYDIRQHVPDRVPRCDGTRPADIENAAFGRAGGDRFRGRTLAQDRKTERLARPLRHPRSRRRRKVRPRGECPRGRMMEWSCLQETSAHDHFGIATIIHGKT